MGDEPAGLGLGEGDELFGDVAGLIERARTRAAVAVNSELVMLYWSVGKRIREDVLGGERAAYGQVVVKRLAARLTERYGRGWGQRNLERMVRFAECFPRGEIASTLSAQLTWSHLVEILAVSGRHRRGFYAATCARERWSVRTARERIASRLYERTLGVGSAEAPEADIAAISTVDDAPELGLVFRDPYVLDFLGLPSEHSESDLERAILDQMQSFLLELGAGFAFVERQKRMPVDGRDYRLVYMISPFTRP